MDNPFQSLSERLAAIESILQELKVLLKYIPEARKKEDEILTIQEASKIINLAVPTIYSLVSKREIPHYKRGKKLYFNKNDLGQWIKSTRRKTVEDIEQEACLKIAGRSKGK